jgi:hypothetical protein
MPSPGSSSILYSSLREARPETGTYATARRAALFLKPERQRELRGYHEWVDAGRTAIACRFQGLRIFHGLVLLELHLDVSVGTCRSQNPSIMFPIVVLASREGIEPWREMSPKALRRRN